jgi:phytoene synthase
MEQKEVIKKKSINFYISSLMFPEEVRVKTFILYAFVRRADDLIDQEKPRVTEYKELKLAYYKALKGKVSGDKTIDDFALISSEFDPSWVRAFFNSIEMDIEGRSYKTIIDLEDYLYGIAEVIGLMMSKLMGLSEESYKYARLLGMAMQFGNIIRDIKEDYELGRVYIPAEILKTFKVKSLKKGTKKTDNMIEGLVGIYNTWQKEAEKGFKFIPRRYIVPIKTASDNYRWTVNSISKDPRYIFTKKVKPGKPRIVAHIIKNILLRPYCSLVNLSAHLGF